MFSRALALERDRHRAQVVASLLNGVHDVHPHARHRGVRERCGGDVTPGLELCRSIAGEPVLLKCISPSQSRDRVVMKFILMPAFAFGFGEASARLRRDKPW